MNDQATKRESDKKNGKNWPQWIEAVCAVLLVFITGFYTHYASKQADASAKAAQAAADAVSHADRNLTITERSWVGPGKPVFNIDHNISKVLPNVPIHGNFNLENYGKSPAVIDNVGVMLEARGTPVPENITHPGWAAGKGVALLFPSQTAISGDSVCTISSSDFGAIKLSTKRLVLHATVNYHDKFGSHTTRLCIQWGHGDSREFTPCPEHNDAN